MSTCTPTDVSLCGCCAGPQYDPCLCIGANRPDLVGTVPMLTQRPTCQPLNS